MYMISINSLEHTASSWRHRNATGEVASRRRRCTWLQAVRRLSVMLLMPLHKRHQTIQRLLHERLLISSIRQCRSSANRTVCQYRFVAEKSNDQQPSA